MTQASTWLLAGGVSNPHPYQGPFPWGPFVAVPLLVIGIPVVIGGLVLTAKSLRTARKPGDYAVGPLVLLVGAAISALAGWLF